MTLQARKAALADIQRLRALYLTEGGFQVRYDSVHSRGWTDSYLLLDSGAAVGYAAVKGRERQDRDTIFELYVIPTHRGRQGELFAALVAASGATFVECQTNDRALTELLFEFARDISASVILFEDHHATAHVVPGAVVRPRAAGDEVFEHEMEPPGDYVVDVGGRVVATGGFMLHYNHPFADLYMEVARGERRRGYAALLLQELKAACYQAGRVPAARCDIGNVASRRALRRAGMRECGFLAFGTIR